MEIELISPKTPRWVEVIKEFDGWVLNCRSEPCIRAWVDKWQLGGVRKLLVVDKDENIYRIGDV